MSQSLEERLSKLEAKLEQKERGLIISKPVAFLVALGCLVLGATVAFATGTFGTSNVPNTIPYEGYLEEGGVPADGERSMTFSLSNDGNEVWSDTKDIQVQNGRFATELGGDDLELSHLDGGALTLSIAVDGVTMTDGQVIQAVPFAAKAATSRRVEGDSVTVTGAVNAGTAVISGTIQAESGFGYVPIGTILPWHKNPHFIDANGDEAGDDVQLPHGWVECNGGTVDDPESSLDGYLIPDLNLQQRFLSGADVSGQFEEDSFPNLVVQFSLSPATTYSHAPETVPSDGTWHPTWLYAGSNAPSANAWVGSRLRWEREAGEFGYREVRPKNMTVVYIMRIK